MLQTSKQKSHRELRSFMKFQALQTPKHPNSLQLPLKTYKKNTQPPPKNPQNRISNPRPAKPFQKANLSTKRKPSTVKKEPLQRSEDPSTVERSFVRAWASWKRSWWHWGCLKRSGGLGVLWAVWFVYFVVLVFWFVFGRSCFFCFV